MIVSDKDLVLIERGCSILNSSRDLLERKAAQEELPRYHFKGKVAFPEEKVSARESMMMALTSETVALYDENKKFEGLGFVDSQGEPHVCSLERIEEFKDGICRCEVCKTMIEAGADNPNLSKEEFLKLTDKVYKKFHKEDILDSLIRALRGER